MKKFTLTKDMWISAAKTAGALFAVCAAVALVISAANMLISPRLAARDSSQETNAMRAVISAARYEKVENLDALGADRTVLEAYTAFNGGEEIGFCVKVAPMGFDGTIEMLVGVDAQGKVTKVHIVNMAESGAGALVGEEEFLNSFSAKSAPITAVRRDAGENQINAVAGATVSSKAVTAGVNAALNAAELIKEAAGNG